MTIAVQGAADSSHGEALSPGPQYDAAQSDPVILEARDLDLRFGGYTRPAIGEPDGPRQRYPFRDRAERGGQEQPAQLPLGLLPAAIGRRCSTAAAASSAARPHTPRQGRPRRTFQGIQTYPSMTVRENILAGLHVHMRTGLLDALAYWPRARARGAGSPSARPRRSSSSWSSRSCATTHVGSLSYGMRKRVDLGRALALRSEGPDHGRADGRHERRREGRSRALHPRHQGCAQDPDRARRARHGSGDGHLRHRHRHGLGPRHRVGAAAADPQRSEA